MSIRVDIYLTICNIGCFLAFKKSNINPFAADPINPLTSRGIRRLHFKIIQCHPGLTYHF